AIAGIELERALVVAASLGCAAVVLERLTEPQLDLGVAVAGLGALDLLERQRILALAQQRATEQQVGAVLGRIAIEHLLGELLGLIGALLREPERGAGQQDLVGCLGAVEAVAEQRVELVELALAKQHLAERFGQTRIAAGPLVELGERLLVGLALAELAEQLRAEQLRVVVGLIDRDRLFGRGQSLVELRATTVDLRPLTSESG